MPQLHLLMAPIHLGGPNGVELGHQVDHSEHLLEREALGINRVDEPHLKRALEHKHSSAINVVAAVHTVRDRVGEEASKAWLVLTSLPQSWQELKVNADLLLKNVGFKTIQTTGIISWKQLGNEVVIKVLAVRLHLDLHPAGGAHVSVALLAILQLARGDPSVHFEGRLLAFQSQLVDNQFCPIRADFRHLQRNRAEVACSPWHVRHLSDPYQLLLCGGGGRRKSSGDANLGADWTFPAKEGGADRVGPLPSW